MPQGCKSKMENKTIWTTPQRNNKTEVIVFINTDSIYTAKDLLAVLEEFKDWELEVAEGGISLYMTRESTPEEQEQYFQFEERNKEYRRMQYLNMKKEFEPDASA